MDHEVEREFLDRLFTRADHLLKDLSQPSEDKNITREVTVQVS